MTSKMKTLIQRATTVPVVMNGSFQVTKSTCVINNGAAINVNLPTVPSSSFTAAGQTVGDTHLQWM